MYVTYLIASNSVSRVTKKQIEVIRPPKSGWNLMLVYTEARTIAISLKCGIYLQQRSFYVV